MRMFKSGIAMCLAISPLAMADELAPVTVETSIFKNQTTDDFAQSVTVLSGEELERKKASSIGETVKDELGVSSTFFSQGSSRPIIRGLGSNRVRVLENGIDSLDASSTSEDHPVTIEPYTADQVEIIRGPSTLRFGPGAIGGVVNVINKRLPQSLTDEKLEVDVGLEHNSVNDGNTMSLQLDGTINNFVWHLDGLDRDTNDYDIDGFADDSDQSDRGTQSNSDLETQNYGFGGAYITDKALFGLAFSRIDSEYGVPGALEGDIRIDSEQYRYDGQIELFNPFSSIDSIELRSTYNNYTHNEVEEDGEIATTFDNEEFESRLEVVHNYNDSVFTAFGLQYNNRDFSAVGEEAFIQPLDQERYGAFVITNFALNTWDLEFGLRFDRDELDPSEADKEEFNTWAFSTGAIKTFSNDLQLNLFASVTERAPQETALYANGPHLATITFEIGDQDLEEETSFNFEVGLGQNKKNFGWQVNTFYNFIDDYIFLDTVDGNSDGIADRVDEEGAFELDGELLLTNFASRNAEFYGLESEVTKRIFEHDAGSVDMRVFADYVRAKFTQGGSDDIPRIPPARLGTSFDAQHGPWSGAVDLTYVFEQNNTAELEEDTDDFTMLNASLSRTVYVADTDVQVFVRGENLLDEDARRHSSFNTDRVVLPGRAIRVGLNFDY